MSGLNIINKLFVHFNQQYESAFQIIIKTKHCLHGKKKGKVFTFNLKSNYLIALIIEGK